MQKKEEGRLPFYREILKKHGIKTFGSLK